MEGHQKFSKEKGSQFTFVPKEPCSIFSNPKAKTQSEVPACNKKISSTIGCYIKEIKNASECINELYKHAGIFKNMREVHFSSVLKYF